MFCKKMKGRIKLLLQEFNTYVDGHIDTALQITTALKQMLASPAADIITAIIPGDLDNKIREQVIKALGEIAEALTIASNCKQCTDINDKLQCFIMQVQQYDPQLQDAVLQKLASLLAGSLDGQRLEQSMYDLYTQAKYSINKTIQ